jgi:hypothetical protein
MNSNNPQVYKVAKQQLETLRKLAQLSIDIDDPQGAKIIQAAEVAIEHRIQITQMDLSPLEYLEHLIDRGFECPEAEWRTTQCYPIDADKLRTQYDSRY